MSRELESLPDIDPIIFKVLFEVLFSLFLCLFITFFFSVFISFLFKIFFIIVECVLLTIFFQFLLVRWNEADVLECYSVLLSERKLVLLRCGLPNLLRFTKLTVLFGRHVLWFFVIPLFLLLREFLRCVAAHHVHAGHVDEEYRLCEYGGRQCLLHGTRSSLLSESFNGISGRHWGVHTQSSRTFLQFFGW